MNSSFCILSLGVHKTQHVLGGLNGNDKIAALHGTVHKLVKLQQLHFSLWSFRQAFHLDKEECISFQKNEMVSTSSPVYPTYSIHKWESCLRKLKIR